MVTYQQMTHDVCMSDANCEDCKVKKQGFRVFET